MNRSWLIPFLLAISAATANGSVLINENFNGGYPPAGWLTNSVLQSGAQSHSAPFSAAYSAAGDFIVTPLLSTPDKLKLWLYRTASGTRPLSVQYSTSSQTGPWTNITTFTLAPRTSWNSNVIDLSGFTNIYIRFLNSSGAQPLYLDDVVISARSNGAETLDLTDLPTSNVLLRPSSSDNPVFAFNLSTSSNGRTITGLSVSNSGSLPPANISVVKLVYDADGSRDVSGGDTAVAVLEPDQNGLWTNHHIVFVSNLNPPSGRDFLVTVDMTASAGNGMSLKLGIPAKKISVDSGVSNSSPLFASKFAYASPSLRVVMNEIAWGGTAASSADEWIELFNTTVSNIDLAGWSLKADDGVPNIGLSGIATNGGYFLVEKSSNDTILDIEADLVAGFGTGLGNSGENLKLFDNLGNLADLVSASGAWPAGTGTPNYYSMERKHAALEDNATNWESNDGIWRNGLDALGNPLNGTPHRANGPDGTETLTLSVLAVSNRILRPLAADIPLVAFRLVSSSNSRTLRSFTVTNTASLDPQSFLSIRLVWDADGSRTWSAADAVAAVLDFDQAGRWTNRNIGFASNLDPPTGRDFLVVADLSGAISNGCGVRLAVPASAAAASSGVSNPVTASALRTLYAQPLLGVVINEIAWSGTAASAADEWFELENATGAVVDLAGWRLTADDGVPDIGLSGLSTNAGFFLVEKTSNNTVSDIDANLVASFGSGLGNTGEFLKLLDAQGRLVDYVDGSSGWPAGTSGPGYFSMERKYPGLEDCATNWADNSGIVRNGLDALGGPVNGTPKKPNSTGNFTLTSRVSNIPDGTFFPGTTNAAVLSFRYLNTKSSPLGRLGLTNLGDLDPGPVSLWLDNPPSARFDPSDTFLAFLSSTGGAKFTNYTLSVASGTLVLATITMPSSTNGLNGRWFRACLADRAAVSISGATNSTGFTNPGTQTCRFDHLTLVAPIPGERTNFRGQQNIAAAVFSLTNDLPGVRLARLTFTNAGDLPASDLSSVELWSDADADGTVTAGDSVIAPFTPSAGLWDCPSATNLTVGGTNLNLMIVVGLKVSASTNKTFQAVFRPGFVSTSGIASLASPVSNARIFVARASDTVLFTAVPVAGQTVDVGQETNVLAFSARSSAGQIFLFSLWLTNLGSLPDGRISGISFYTSRSGPAARMFTNTSPNRWTLLPGAAVDLSSNVRRTNFVRVSTTMTFTNVQTIRLALRPAALAGTGTGVAPATTCTNAFTMKVSNRRPVRPPGFRWVTTNFSSCVLGWSNGYAIRDFGAFGVFFGTNESFLTNKIWITNASATQSTVPGLASGRRYLFKLRARDLAGLVSTTNTSLVQARTRIDTNAPVFDPSSLAYSVNNKVVRLSWKRAVDPENSRPLRYFVYASTNQTSAPTNMSPTLSTTNTNTTLSFDSGSWRITVLAMDAFTNLSAYTGFMIVVTIANDVSDLDRVYFYPNPVREGETVHFNYFTDETEIRVFNVRGDLVLETRDRNLVLPDHLAAGIYFVVIKDAEARKIKRLIYLR